MKSILLNRKEYEVIEFAIQCKIFKITSNIDKYALKEEPLEKEYLNELPLLIELNEIIGNSKEIKDMGETGDNHYRILIDERMGKVLIDAFATLHMGYQTEIRTKILEGEFEKVFMMNKETFQPMINLCIKLNQK